jgi:hypothetical protein
MLGNLGHLLKSKLAVAVLGAALVAGTGATVAFAATGNAPRLPFLGQGQSSHHDARDGGNDNNDDANNDGDHDGNHQVEGAISSIDAGNSSFVLTSEHNGNVTVTVNNQTVFDNGVNGFADLKVGMFAEVKGNVESDKSVAATKIERGNDDAHDGGNDDSSKSGSDGSGTGSDDHGGGSGSTGGDTRVDGALTQ